MPILTQKDGAIAQKFQVKFYISNFNFLNFNIVCMKTIINGQYDNNLNITFYIILLCFMHKKIYIIVTVMIKMICMVLSIYI